MQVMEEFLTVEEVAKRLRLSEDSITRLLRLGRMPGYKVEGSWRVDRQELEQYLADKKNTKTKNT